VQHSSQTKTPKDVRLANILVCLCRTTVDEAIPPPHHKLVNHEPSCQTRLDKGEGGSLHMRSFALSALCADLGI
jgi:hypothetical protein